jgi:small-conductance mechanosensitive channel
MEEGFGGFLQHLAAWDFALFQAGETAVRVSTVLKVLLALLLLVYVTRWLRNRVLRLLTHSPMDVGTRMTVATLLQYVVLVVGVSLIMQNVGLKLSALSVLAGAVGVGLGFGLQNIVSNFVSGLIVMFERPVRIGDRIEIGGIEGDVVAIKARSTVLRTQRGAAAIIPNQKFITEYVRNFAQGHDTSALALTFKLHHDQDLDAAIKLIEEAVHDLGAALAQPPPEVHCSAVDAGGVTVEVLAFVHGDVMERSRLQSQLLRQVRRRVGDGGLKLA